MPPGDHGYEGLPFSIGELLEIANRKVRPDHQEFLDLTVRTLCQGMATRRVFVCLWLRDWKKLRYLLDLCSATGVCEDGDTRAALEDRLLSVLVEEKIAPESDEHRSHIMATLAACPRVREIAADLGADNVVESFALKDGGYGKPHGNGNSLHECRLIGFLQVWSNTPIQPAENEIVNWVARSLATNLFRHRSRRELEALKEMQKAFKESHVESKTWLRTAAIVLGHATSADYCLVMESTPPRQLRGVVAWSSVRGCELNPDRFVAGQKSVIRRLFETPDRTIRITDWNDPAERLKECGTAEYDGALSQEIEQWAGRQSTWMAAPIVAREQVLAVIVLFNKHRNLPRQFSATDEEILESVSQYLANVLPPILARKMIEDAARSEVGMIASLGAREKEEAEAASANLFKVLERAIPNISGATLWIDNGGSQTDAVAVHLGGNEFLKNETAHLHQETVGVITVESTEGHEHLLVLKVNGLRQSAAHFGVTLFIPRLSDHELGLLNLFIRFSLANALRAREILETELRVFVEMRHNIRVGLHGLSHLTPALNIFEFLKKRGYPNATGLIQKAGKSIRRAHLFAEQSRLLMEHARLLHTGLTTSEIAPKKESVGEIAREVILALQPDSDRYTVPVDLDDQIARNEEMEVDRPLMSIVFFNLIENAIKYSKAHEHAHVRLYLADRQWHCEIQSVGRYLDDAMISQIFQPFVRRFDSELRKARPGTGLGLPVVRLIVAAHRGAIEVTSAPPLIRDGAEQPTTNTFTISMPRWIR